MNFKSILFVPALRPDLFEKAAKGNATAICIDLEDSIVRHKKAEARSSLEQGFVLPASSQKILMIRVNSESDLLPLDICSVRDNVHFVVLPKAGSTDQVNKLGNALDSQFGEGGPEIICLIESGADLDNLRRSVEPFHKRVRGMALGTEDLATDFNSSPNAAIVEHCFFELAMLCRRWKILLLGYPGSISEYQNLDKFSDRVRRGVETGASGAFCIHPKQAEILNSLFTPSKEAVAYASRVVEAFEIALANGDGVCSIDGKMIDKPVYLNAKAVLSRAL